MSTVEKILLEFEPETRNLLPVLKRISAAFGYVSQKDAQKAAKYFDLPLSRVYETVSFYDLINIKKQPELTIEVCSGTNCAVNGSFEIIREIENLFHVKAGDENNPRIKLEIISCLGQCGEGPVVVVNGKVYTKVTVSGVHGILKEWV
ncbi:MAG: iron-hydrogenase subunit gamma [Patescibacteria group bacterium]|nr:iron-hydrogenase subunit gamma [Patescibacteria group bacterium]